MGAATSAPQPESRPQPGKPPISFYLKSPTITLIVINVLAFIIISIIAKGLFDPNPQVLMRVGANYGPKTLGGQPWRMLSSMFLHAGLLHLVLNMWALFNLGILGEILFGRRSFLALYFACGIGGAIASCWWHPATVGVGASGAIFGVAGALLPALGFQKNKRMRAMLRGNFTSIAFFVVYSIVIGAAAAQIDNSAHLGGLITGLILGLVLPSSPGSDTQAHTTRHTLIFASTAVVLLVSFLVVRSTKIIFINYDLAERAYRAKQYDKAIALARDTAAKKPDFVSAHYLLGTMYIERGDYRGGIVEMQRVTELRPDFADAYAQLCVARLRSGDVPGSVAACKRAVELDGQDPDQHFNYGLTLRVSHDNTAAVEAFRKAVTLKPNGADENYYLGISLEDLKRYDEAVGPLEVAVRAAPTDVDSRRALARVYIRLGRREDARNILQQTPRSKNTGALQ